MAPPNHAASMRRESFREVDFGMRNRRAPSVTQKEAVKKREAKPSITLALLYGAINSLLTIPCMFGYASIIFGSAVYHDSMPALAKLVLFSSVVHQVFFSLMSTLPFAIGQVQDAGLIFLQQITASVAFRLADRDVDVILSTAVVTTAFCTAALGVCVIVVGKFRLARFVSYLPMPVVGGYLAFIGYFCLEAGLSMCTGAEFGGLADFKQLGDIRTLLLALPGLLCGLLLFYIGRQCTHMAAMPLAMVAIPLVFYTALAVSEYDLQDARAAGLVATNDSPAKWYEAFSFFQFELVEWSVIIYQVPAFLSMVVVVAFSSSLDVAAIEMDMGVPLDTNAELVTVGWSNVFSGLFGGFTGSYIFSQTIFTYRTKCWSRLVGWVVAISELWIFLLHVDPLTYVPLFFFAAMLIFIAWDLMFEWLVEVHHKLLPFESITLFATFLGILAFGLNLGLLAGIILAAIGFVVSYASQTLNTMQRVNKTSRVLRPAVERRTLQMYRDKILCLELRGELFFGSATGVLQQIKEFLAIPETASGTGVGETKESPSEPSESSELLKDSGDVPTYAADAVGEINRGENIMYHHAVPSFVVFDCAKLKKIDASAARTCFMPLQKLSEQDNVCIAYAGLDEQQEHLLTTHGTLTGDNVAVFSQLDAALDWCERNLIVAAKHDPANGFWKLAHFGRRNSVAGSYTGTLSDLLRQMLELPGQQEALEEFELADYYTEKRVAAGDAIFSIGERADAMFLVLQGSVVLKAAQHEVSLSRGGVFGWADTYLALEERTFGALAETDCVLAEVSRDDLDRMMAAAPRTLAILQHAVIQFSAMELANEPV